MSGLKLKLNTNGIPKAPSQDTPLATPGGSKPRIKLSIKSNPSTPAPAPSDNPKLKKTKAGRPSKPSQKLLESKKRIKVETDTEEEDDGGTISVQQPATKKVKLTFGAPKTPAPSRTPVTPVVFKTKSKVGKPPPRDPGTGYDSEASDREIDPVIEEQFVLRMPPGDDCEYVRKMIEEKKIGIPKAQGGADIFMKFFELRGRRGAVTVRGNIYAATLVDLPSITEGMKSWDKRGWWKSADICQMLLVFAPVKSEEEARTIALPDEIDRDTHQYPHGLTPPMHFARQRRFRKRLHKSTIERVEEEVQRLLKADESAVSSSYEIIDPDAEERRASHFDHFDAESNSGYGHDDEEDAEGEEDDQDQGYFNHQPVNSREEEVEDDPDLEREMEEAFADELEAPTPDVAETPLALPAAEPEEDSGDESFDDEDDGEEAAVVPAELDEEQKQEQARIDGIREDIAELKRALWSNEQNLSRSTNALIRKRLEDTVRTQKRELNLKMSSIGEGEENE